MHGVFAQDHCTNNKTHAMGNLLVEFQEKEEKKKRERKKMLAFPKEEGRRN